MNALRGIRFLICQLVVTSWLKPSKMDIRLINVRVFSLYCQQQCYAGIGEGLVVLLTNFHE